jgi:hypothetical protein
MSKAQTATEYLIILAVVIIIALIVVGVMGGIPELGGGASEAAAKAALASQKVGVTSYAISDYDTVLTIKNNNLNTIRIDAIAIGGQLCLDVGTPKLTQGESKQITCKNVYEYSQETAELGIEINYTDWKTQASYSQEDDSLKMKGAVADKYLATLDNHFSYDVSEKGCWNATANPHPICTCYDLNRTRSQLGWNYSQQNSIDFDRCMDVFGDAGWTSGSGWTPTGIFTGSFDGGNNTISGLYINDNGEYTGLFARANDMATLKNVRLVNSDVTGTGYTGGLSGQGRGTAINIIMSGGSVAGGSSAGGLIGSVRATLGNIQVLNVDVANPGSNLGMLAGAYQSGGSITGSIILTGTLTGGSNVGPLAGQIVNGCQEVSASSSLVDVSGVTISSCDGSCSTACGGLVGFESGE